MANEPTIVIPIGDWDSEAKAAEVDISTWEKMLEVRIGKGWHPAKMARLYLVARERGETDPEILASNKLLLMTGTARAITDREVKMLETVMLKNGKEVKVRSLVAPVHYEQPTDADDDDQLELDAMPPGPEKPVDNNPAPVWYDDPLAVDRAIGYLMHKIPGHIYRRMTTIAAGGGDVMGIWREFVDLMEGKLLALV